MVINKAIINLIKDISEKYEQTNRAIGPNIFRGHLRSISTDIEDCIALFISSILPLDYKIYLDPSVYVDGHNHRPDLLVLNEKNECYAMIEIKANMGYCRNAEEVITREIETHDIFSNERSLSCNLSSGEAQVVLYTKKTKLYLIALTAANCSERNHDNNRDCASNNGIKHFILFDGWYDSLTGREITDFANDLLNTNSQK